MKYDPAWARGEKLCSVQVISDGWADRLITIGHLQRGTLIIHQLKEKQLLFLVSLMCTYQFYMYNSVQETNIVLL